MNIKAHSPKRNNAAALRHLQAQALPPSGQSESQPNPQVGQDRVTLSTEALESRRPQNVGHGVMGSNIRSDYADNMRTQGEARLNPESRESRLRDLDHISQLDNNGQTIDDPDRCGPSALVAGAYYGDGTDGVRGLVQDMDAYRRRHNIENDPFEGTDVREHLASGELTRDDLNRVQDGLYGVIQDRQDAAYGEGTVPTGISDNALGNFIDESPNVRRTMDNNDLAIATVDTNGNGQGNHFVLGGQHEGESFVYDPWSIRGDDGQLNQVTQDPEQVQAYRDAVTQSYNGTDYTYDGGRRR